MKIKKKCLKTFSCNFTWEFCRKDFLDIQDKLLLVRHFQVQLDVALEMMMAQNNNVGVIQQSL
jgi:hypothetical protein